MTITFLFMPHMRFLLALLVLAHASFSRAQTVSAVAPTNWTTWAEVDVSWTHPNPLPSDWVGAFLPEWNATYIQVQALVFNFLLSDVGGSHGILQWWPVTASSSWPGSSGSLRFRLLNGRHPFVFRYFRGDDMLAESNQVEPLGATPLQACLRSRFSRSCHFL